MLELSAGGATRAVAASGSIGSLCARDGAIPAVCMHVYDVLGFVRTVSIEILAWPREKPSRSLADWWKTVTGTSTQLSSLQCAVWRSEMVQVVARYIEDRSVDVRHVAVVTLSSTAGKSDRNVIKLVLVCLDDGLALRTKTKKDEKWHTCSQRLWVPQLVSKRFSLGRCR